MALAIGSSFESLIIQEGNQIVYLPKLNTWTNRKYTIFKYFLDNVFYTYLW